MSPEAVHNDIPFLYRPDLMLTETEVEQIFSLRPKELELFRKAGVLTGEPYRERWWKPRRYRYSVYPLLRLTQRLVCPNGVYQAFASQLPADWKHPHFAPELWRIAYFREATFASVRLVDEILKEAVAERVTDIYVEEQKAFVGITFRVDGTMSPKYSLAPQIRNVIPGRIKVITDLNPLLRTRPQSGLLKANLPVGDASQEIWIRVNILPTSFGEKVSLHLTYPDVPKLSEKIYTWHVWDLTRQSSGLILLSGPRGTDTITTFRALLEQQVTSSRNVFLIETEPEFPMEGITRTILDPENGLTEKEAVRSALRQGAEVIAFANLASKEAAEAAMDASQSGALVLVCLRTKDPGVLSAYERFVFLGISSERASRLISGIIAITPTEEGEPMSETLRPDAALRLLLATYPYDRHLVSEVEWATWMQTSPRAEQHPVRSRMR